MKCNNICCNMHNNKLKVQNMWNNSKLCDLNDFRKLRGGRRLWVKLGTSGLYSGRGFSVSHFWINSEGPGWVQNLRVRLEYPGEAPSEGSLLNLNRINLFPPSLTGLSRLGRLSEWGSERGCSVKSTVNYPNPPGLTQTIRIGKLALLDDLPRPKRLAC